MASGGKVKEFYRKVEKVKKGKEVVRKIRG
jgi:hypothetical protein